MRVKAKQKFGLDGAVTNSAIFSAGLGVDFLPLQDGLNGRVDACSGALELLFNCRALDAVHAAGRLPVVALVELAQVGNF